MNPLEKYRAALEVWSEEYTGGAGDCFPWEGIRDIEEDGLTEEEAEALGERNWRAMYPAMCEYVATAEPLPEWFADKLIDAMREHGDRVYGAWETVNPDYFEFPLGWRSILLAMGLPVLHVRALDAIERLPDVETIREWKRP